MFNPRANYWQADDGRVFFGGSESIVKSDDGAFVEWQRDRNRPTPWPRDAAGEQTDAALQEVLGQYGMFVGLSSYAADARWRAEIAGVEIGGIKVATDDRSKMMVMGARIIAAANPNWSTIWRDMSGVGHEITAAQMIAISDAVQAHVNATFVTLAIVLGEIADGHIADRAAIDAAFAAPGTFSAGVTATHENAAAEQQAVEKEKEVPPADAPAPEAQA